MPALDILIPTRNRLSALVMALTGVSLQTQGGIHVVIADQSNTPVSSSPVIQSLIRMIEAGGGSVELHHRPPVWGIAEQRHFLLDRAQSAYTLFLDDDVLMEPWVAARLLEMLGVQGCGFIGAFPAGLSFLDDIRPEQQRIEYWEGPVRPEVVEPGSPQWERWQLHRAANLYHVGQALSPGDVRLYKVAWIGACVLYDREKLLEIGGYSFWQRLPRYHSGEDVLVQNLLMRRWGGGAIVPAGTYFAECPSSVLNAAGKVDGHALELLPEMLQRYVPETAQP